MSQFDEFRNAVAEAERTFKAADSVAENMARILLGRLRNVSPYLLKKMKREISQFNAGTSKWKEDA